MAESLPQKWTDNIATEEVSEEAISEFSVFSSSVITLDQDLGAQLPEFCSISLDTLESYCNYVRKSLDLAGVRNKGMKFIFAQYPMESTDPKANPLYKGLVHIVLRPVDLAALASANTEGLDYPTETSKVSAIKSLNYMHITPPFGAHVNPGPVGSGGFGGG